MGVGAYSFDGSSDGISFSHMSNADGLDKLCLAFWVKPITNPTFGYFAAQIGATGTGTGNTDGFGFLQPGTDATGGFAVDRNASSNPEKSQTGVFTTNVWNACIMQIDGTQSTVTDRLRVYVNSVEVTSWATDTNNFPTTLGTNNQPFTIGFGESTLWSNCEIADVGVIFGRVLTGLNIISHGAGVSIGNFVTTGDFWSSFRVDQNDENGGRTGTLVGTPTLVTGPSLTYPGGVTNFSFAEYLIGQEYLEVVSY